MSGPYFTDEEWEERLKKTNQQATANHTVKMFNQSRTQWLASDGNPANESKEIKMTRKEAIDNVRAAFNPGYPVESFVNALEVLGLIKFDDEKSVSAVDVLNAYTCNASAILESLDKHGYKIVKK